MQGPQGSLSLQVSHTSTAAKLKRQLSPGPSVSPQRYTFIHTVPPLYLPKSFPSLNVQLKLASPCLHAEIQTTKINPDACGMYVCGICECGKGSGGALREIAYFGGVCREKHMLADWVMCGLTPYVPIMPTFPTPTLGDDEVGLPLRCLLIGRDAASHQRETSLRLPSEGPRHTGFQTRNQGTRLLLSMSACLSLLKPQEWYKLLGHDFFPTPSWMEPQWPPELAEVLLGVALRQQEV